MIQPVQAYLLAVSLLISLYIYVTLHTTIYVKVYCSLTSANNAAPPYLKLYKKLQTSTEVVFSQIQNNL